MHQHGYIGRKMRLPKLQQEPAIVIAAFGASRRAKTALSLFVEKIDRHYPAHEKFQACTSAIIRAGTGLPGLHETLARVEAAGFRRAVVQPLHIFPGTEYQQLIETCEYFPGLRVFTGETLLHRWEFVRQVLAVVQREFLPPDEGLNLLAVHGTPLAADPVNIVYLGLERLITDLYGNVLVAAVEGVPDQEAVMRCLRRGDFAPRHKRIKIIPMMYLAGIHVEDDLMGEKDSWLQSLTEMGFQVECPTITHAGGTFFKGLAFYPEVIDFFMKRLTRALDLARLY